MKVLANDGISNAGKVVLEEAGFEVVTENVPQEKLIDTINNEGYTSLLVRSATQVRKDIIDSCSSLKLIGRGGVGMDNIDVDYAKGKGLEVINTPAASSRSVAELVMGQLFTLARTTYDSNRNMPTKGATEFKQLKKKYAKGVELNGKTLGIIGFGRIGQETAKYAMGIGMNVVFHSLHPKSVVLDLKIGGNEVHQFELETKTQEEVLQQSDFISIHVPGSDQPIIGEKEFAVMKDGVRIVNAARGGVIDEDALLKALESGKVAAAALDVFENEPTPRKELLEHDRISLTPHIGAATLEAQDRIGTELAGKIINHFL